MILCHYCAYSCNNNYLLTESEIFTGSSQTETLPYRSVNTARLRFEVSDFPVMTERIRSISCLAHGILLCF